MPLRVAYDPRMMRSQPFVASILLGCVVSLHAQTAPQPQIPLQNPKSNWTIVESIEPGTTISIQAGGHWHKCVFDRAADEYVECSPRRLVFAPVSPITGVVDYRRAKITKIRIRKTIPASGPLGVLLGVGIGVGLGAVEGNSGGFTRSGEMQGLGLIGGIAGGTTGYIFPFHHNVVIYQQP